jgi:hypothetical protein
MQALITECPPPPTPGGERTPGISWARTSTQLKEQGFLLYNIRIYLVFYTLILQMVLVSVILVEDIGVNN